MEDPKTAESSRSRQTSRGKSSSSSSPEAASKELVLMPSSRTTLLTQALVGKLKAADDLRYHLSWTYGGFIEDIPKRLGVNEALDASVDALISTHSSLGSYARGFTSSESLAKYSHALNALILYLDDPNKARTVETLCAVMILLICQSFIGAGGGCYSGRKQHWVFVHVLPNPLQFYLMYSVYSTRSPKRKQDSRNLLD
jgi:hypothetical protein